MYEATNLVKEAAGEPEEFRSSPFGIDETKYSSLWKLLRITAICLKFIKYRVWNKCSQALQEQMFLKCAVLKRLFSDVKKQSLYYIEIHNTTLLWVYVICRQFCEVFTVIRRNKVNCLQKQVGLEVDEFGILRCHGRFQNADMSESAKYPKLLPRHEYYTSLLIQYVHERLIHAGVSHTLASLHQDRILDSKRKSRG